LVAISFAIDLDGAFSFSADHHCCPREGDMGQTKRALEAENEQLWQKLEQLYEQLGELLDDGVDEELDDE
jgi:hypothetical protein